jgi:hypothetical protein
VLSITEASAGSSFDGALIIGDPPPAGENAKVVAAGVHPMAHEAAQVLAASDLVEFNPSHHLFDLHHGGYA